jgi:hypothetical protein
MHFTDLMLLTGLEKHALRDRGLTGVDVGDDSEVSGVIQGVFARHMWVKKHVTRST